MSAVTGGATGLGSRWTQLALGVIAMMAISSPQYAWPLLQGPIQKSIGVELTTVQWTFSILIVLQTGLSPVQGFLVDRFGLRRLVILGCALSGLSWIAAAFAHDALTLYLTYGALGGIGTGIVYVGVIGLMARWFPDRRGFACGMAAAGYGFGAIVTTFPIDILVKATGYRHTLIELGLILGAIGVAAAFGLKEPERAARADLGAGVAPQIMLRSPVFWLLFVMMTMMSTGGLMVLSQFGVFTKEFGIANAVVFGFAALPLALTLDRATNGATRPVFGWISDRIGRENTMALAFIGEGAAVALMLSLRDNPTAFVLMSGVVFFGWGEIFSLFPSTLTDSFGSRHATTNYGFLYIAQGIGSVLGGPVAAQIHKTEGSWLPVFALVIVMDMLTGVLALVALKPLRRRHAATRGPISAGSVAGLTVSS